MRRDETACGALFPERIPCVEKVHTDTFLKRENGKLSMDKQVMKTHSGTAYCKSPKETTVF